MECRYCGAPLREGARFCNSCGSNQVDSPDGSQISTPVLPSSASSMQRDNAPGSSGRARRPPRVPRASDSTDATDVADTSDTSDSASRARSQTVPVSTSILDTAAIGEEQEFASMEPASALDAETGATELAEPDMVEPDVKESVPVADTAASEPESAAEAAPPAVPPEPGESAASSQVASAAPAWEDADTVEYNVVLARSQTLDAVSSASQPAESEMPALAELARSRDALSWPLPQSIIVGGRYRVEEVITTAPDTPGAENVYCVHDLQGYERCWSCGAEYGVTSANDRFCQECGADMLSHDYLMYERRADASPEAPAAPTGEEAPSEAAAEGATEDAAVQVFSQGARAYRVMPRPTAPPLFPRGAHIVAALATDTGASRTGHENEDSAGIVALTLSHDSYTEPLTLCVVADGLGGHASGQTASRLVVRLLAEHVLRAAALPYLAPSPTDGEGQADIEAMLVGALKDGIEAANKAICARNSSSGADMGSTCVAALIHRDTAYLANAGDSRAYVLEEEGLRRITTDHSLVEQLIAGGLITPEERYTHPQRNQIFRSLGDEPDVPLDTFTQKLRPGMRLLLCSDGLWEMVRDDEMAHIVRETTGTQQACDLLIQAANAHGGEDNISAVVIDISA